MRWLTLSLEARISVSGPSGQSMFRKKCGNIGWNMKQVLFDIVIKRHFRTWCSTTQKDRNFSRKCTTSFICCQNYNGEVVDRSWLCFSPSQTCVYCFTCKLMCADTTKCAHFLIRKGIFDWKHALERLRNHEHSMKHIYMPQLHLVADVINHYEELIQT